jgi:hypothetical protein
MKSPLPYSKVIDNINLTHDGINLAMALPAKLGELSPLAGGIATWLEEHCPENLSTVVKKGVRTYFAPRPKAVNEIALGTIVVHESPGLESRISVYAPGRIARPKLCDLDFFDQLAALLTECAVRRG